MPLDEREHLRPLVNVIDPRAGQGKLFEHRLLEHLDLDGRLGLDPDKHDRTAGTRSVNVVCLRDSIATGVNGCVHTAAPEKVAQCRARCR